MPRGFRRSCRWSCPKRSPRARRSGSAMFVAMRYGIARGDLRQRSGLRHRRGRLRHRAQRPADPQGLNAVVEVFIVSFVTSTISAMTILLTGVWQSGLTSTRRRRRRLQHGDADLRRLDRRVLRVSLRLHDADRVGVLRRAVLRVHPRTRGDDPVPLDLLPADPVRGDLEGRRRLGLGRSDERPSGLPEPHRRHWPERPRRRSDARARKLDEAASAGSRPIAAPSPLDRPPGRC